MMKKAALPAAFFARFRAALGAAQPAPARKKQKQEQIQGA